MKIFVFDIDNTIIIHTNQNNNFYNKKTESRLPSILSHINKDLIYIYTNGTFGHGKGVIENLKLSNQVKRIFARDNIPWMKPYINSFRYVNNIINKESNSSQNEIIFFDDLEENLMTAKQIGWNTVWISPDFLKKKKYIDYTFPNIYEALIYFNKN